MIIDTGKLGPIRVEPTPKATIHAKQMRDVFKRLASTTTNPRTMTAALAMAAASDADLDLVFRSVAI